MLTTCSGVEWRSGGVAARVGEEWRGERGVGRELDSMESTTCDTNTELR